MVNFLFFYDKQKLISLHIDMDSDSFRWIVRFCTRVPGSGTHTTEAVVWSLPVAMWHYVQAGSMTHLKLWINCNFGSSFQIISVPADYSILLTTRGTGHQTSQFCWPQEGLTIRLVMDNWPLQEGQWTKGQCPRLPPHHQTSYLSFQVLAWPVQWGTNTLKKGYVHSSLFHEFRGKAGHLSPSFYFHRPVA